MSAHIWTDAEDLYLKQFYETKGTRECAKQLGIGISDTRKRAERLNLYSDGGRRTNGRTEKILVRGWGWI